MASGFCRLVGAARGIEIFQGGNNFEFKTQRVGSAAVIDTEVRATNTNSLSALVASLLRRSLDEQRSSPRRWRVLVFTRDYLTLRCFLSRKQND